MVPGLHHDVGALSAAARAGRAAVAGNRSALAESAVVVGGGSDLAAALLAELAGRGLRRALLVGPREASLERVADELRRASAVEAATLVLDVRDAEGVEALPAAAASRLGPVDLVVVAAGALAGGELGDLDAAAVVDLVAVNFAGPAAAALCFAKSLAVSGGGRIVVFSSVAGVRVRRANFVYGAAKAGLDGFCQGLSDSLAGTGVSLMVVRPGFVHTRMTAGLRPQPLSVGAGEVARAVVRGLERQAAVVWVPPVLGPLSLLLRAVPRPLWRRLRR